MQDADDAPPHVDVNDVRNALRPLLRRTLARGDAAFDIVLRLLITHPTWGQRLDDVQGARVRLSRANQTLQLQLRTNSRWFTVSWRQCALPRRAPRPNNDARRQLAAAMRHAVRRETHSWRRRYFAEGGAARCASCEATTRLQVDHANVPFSAVRDNFLAGEAAPPATFDFTRSCVPRFRRADAAFARRWRAYHAHAVAGCYQLLCLTCNASKSNRSTLAAATP